MLNALGQDILNFNMTHSQGLALYGITRGRKIGIDLEYIRYDFACEQIAQRFFAPREYAALRSLSPEMKHEAFFNGWTRKEAYIKARGEGLSFPLDQFEVSLIPGEPARLLEVERGASEAARWSLRELDPGPCQGRKRHVHDRREPVEIQDNPDPSRERHAHPQRYLGPLRDHINAIGRGGGCRPFR